MKLGENQALTSETSAEWNATEVNWHLYVEKGLINEYIHTKNNPTNLNTL